MLYRNGLNDIHVPIILRDEWISQVSLILIKLIFRFKYTCAGKLILASFMIFQRRFFKSCGHVAISVIETCKLILDSFDWVLMIDVGAGQWCRIFHYLYRSISNFWILLTFDLHIGNYIFILLFIWFGEIILNKIFYYYINNFIS